MRTYQSPFDFDCEPGPTVREQWKSFYALFRMTRLAGKNYHAESAWQCYLFPQDRLYEWFKIALDGNCGRDRERTRSMTNIRHMEMERMLYVKCGRKPTDLRAMIRKVMSERKD